LSLALIEPSLYKFVSLLIEPLRNKKKKKENSKKLLFAINFSRTNEKEVQVKFPKLIEVVQ
jgi:hypothetical protein